MLFVFHSMPDVFFSLLSSLSVAFVEGMCSAVCAMVFLCVTDKLSSNDESHICGPHHCSKTYKEKPNAVQAMEHH